MWDSKKMGKNILKYLTKTVKYKKHIKNKMILIDTPSGGNLGDHAIVLAELQELNAMGISTYELTNMQINYRENNYAKITPRNQCVLVPGGGFLGSLWPDEEERFRRIVKAFKKQKIIVFPHTITFDLTTTEGREYLEESQQIYSSHPNLIIFVRENRSYEFMQQFFPKVKCFLVPDIVTLLNIPVKKQIRSGILFCMRSDLEKSIDDIILEKMITAVQTKYSDEKIE